MASDLLFMHPKAAVFRTLAYVRGFMAFRLPLYAAAIGASAPTGRCRQSSLASGGLRRNVPPIDFSSRLPIPFGKAKLAQERNRLAQQRSRMNFFTRPLPAWRKRRNVAKHQLACEAERASHLELTFFLTKQQLSRRIIGGM